MQRHIEALNVLTKTACTHWSCEGRYRSALYTVDEIVAVYKCIHLAIIYYDFFTSVYVLQIFFCFFLLFFCPPKIWDNRSRERLNRFSWNFYQTIPGKWSLKRRAAAWWMANVDDLRNIHYDSGAITRGRHGRRLRYKIMSARMDLI